MDRIRIGSVVIHGGRRVIRRARGFRQAASLSYITFAHVLMSYLLKV